MTDSNSNARSVRLDLVDGTLVVRNDRAGVLELGVGDDERFSPVELLLAAIGGCSGLDVQALISRRCPPESLTIRVDGSKVRDSTGNHLDDIGLTFSVAFPEGEPGDAGREALARVVARTNERVCVVSRTVQRPTAVGVQIL